MTKLYSIFKRNNQSASANQTGKGVRISTEKIEAVRAWCLKQTKPFTTAEAARAMKMTTWSVKYRVVDPMLKDSELKATGEKRNRKLLRA